MFDRRTFLMTFLAMRRMGFSEDLPNTHNMMLVGEGAAFLSHLPMFRRDESVPELNDAKTEYTSPHRFQVILEAVFTREGKDVTATYFSDREKNPKVNMYTVEPAEFVLSRLFTPDSPNPTLRSFRGTVFRGHLERQPNQRILPDVRGGEACDSRPPVRSEGYQAGGSRVHSVRQGRGPLRLPFHWQAARFRPDRVGDTGPR